MKTTSYVCAGLCILVMTAFDAAYAQNTPTLQEQLEPLARAAGKREDKMITLSIENDSLGGGTDGNYSSGVRLSYMDINSELPAWADEVADVIPTFDLNATTSVYYSLGHNIYTPSDIRQAAQDPRDRPWAGFLYGSVGMATITDNHKDEIEVTLGVIGPAALGEPIQKFVHKHITPSPRPEGWDNQLKNEPALMVGWQRSYPQYFAADIAGFNAQAEPFYGLTLGNVYTHANGGITFRVGPEADRWNDMQVRVRPAMPGTGYFTVQRGEDRWSWNLFGGVEGRAVARNIFLDGNTFTDSHDVDKRAFVFDANAGVAFTYGRARVSYSAVYRSKEFNGQEDPAVFGAVNIGYRF